MWLLGFIFPFQAPKMLEPYWGLMKKNLTKVHFYIILTLIVSIFLTQVYSNRKTQQQKERLSAIPTFFTSCSSKRKELIPCLFIGLNSFI